jgi:FKBP-type peptidyl-prolyl cis-trans isomerase FkpA
VRKLGALSAIATLTVGAACARSGPPPAPASPEPAPALPSGDTGSRPLITLPNGLQIQDLVVGTGEAASTYRTVTVHYVMYLQGQKFESSYDRGTPFTFILGAGTVIKGWEQGIKGMRVGGKRKLIIPPALAYPDGQDRIPPNSTLTYEIELLDVE